MTSKSRIFLCLLSFLLAACFMPQTAQAFVPVGTSPLTVATKSTETSSQLNFFGKPKDDGSPGDYVCKDCGYVFTKGPEAWAKLDDKYKCPPCGAPKFRFKKVPKGSASGKVEVKKSWF